MKPGLRKTIDWIVGVTLIVVGVVSGFVPILQGWVFIIAGLALLSTHSPVAKRLYDRFKGSVKKVRDKITDRRGESDPPEEPK